MIPLYINLRQLSVYLFCDCESSLNKNPCYFPAFIVLALFLRIVVYFLWVLCFEIQNNIFTIWILFRHFNFLFNFSRLFIYNHLWYLLPILWLALLYLLLFELLLRLSHSWHHLIVFLWGLIILFWLNDRHIVCNIVLLKNSGIDNYFLCN